MQRCINDCGDDTIDGTPNSKSHSNESEVCKTIFFGLFI